MSRLQSIQEAIDQQYNENKILFEKLCPENLTADGPLGPLTVFQRGPHHWVRVGKWTDIKIRTTVPGLYHRDEKNEMVPASVPPYETRVDRPIYECVYCLQTQRSERKEA